MDVSTEAVEPLIGRPSLTNNLIMDVLSVISKPTINSDSLMERSSGLLVRNMNMSTTPITKKSKIDMLECDVLTQSDVALVNLLVGLSEDSSISEVPRMDKLECDVLTQSDIPIINLLADLSEEPVIPVIPKVGILECKNSDTLNLQGDILMKLNDPFEIISSGRSVDFLNNEISQYILESQFVTDSILENRPQID